MSEKASERRRGTAIEDLAGEWTFSARGGRGPAGPVKALAEVRRATAVFDVPGFAKDRALRISLRLREGTLVGEYFFLTPEGESRGDGRYVDFEIFDGGKRLLGFPSGSRDLERWEFRRQ